MGAYAPLPFVDAAMIRRIEKEIVAPTLTAMEQEGYPYTGILYPGLILTQDGPKVLEFNARFGDPETQPLMMLLETDLLDILEAVETPRRSRTTWRALRGNIIWRPGAAACVVLTSKGYPETSEKGVRVEGLDTLAKQKNCVAFHAATKVQEGTIATDGGRVLGVTAYGKDVPSAVEKVYQAIGQAGIHFDGMHYRTDIGTHAEVVEEVTISTV